jgi:hypothetical protein
MGKRGRPTVAQREGYADIGEVISNSSLKTKRQQANEFYITAMFTVLNSESASDIPYIDGIWKIVTVNGYHAVKQKSSIIEQLGRMLIQDGYQEDIVLEYVRKSAEYYHEGYTVKEISYWLRNIRIKNKGA